MHQHHAVVAITDTDYRCRAQGCRRWGDLEWAIRHVVAHQYRVKPDDGRTRS